MLKGVAVTAIDSLHNRIIVGDPASLFYHTLILREWHSPNPQKLFASNSLRVTIRGIGRNPNGTAHIYPYPAVEVPDTRMANTDCTNGNSTSRLHEMLRIILDGPAWAPAKGQPVVIYQDDLVLGGGILDDYLP